MARSTENGSTERMGNAPRWARVYYYQGSCEGWQVLTRKLQGTAAASLSAAEGQHDRTGQAQADYLALPWHCRLQARQHARRNVRAGGRRAESDRYWAEAALAHRLIRPGFSETLRALSPHCTSRRRLSGASTSDPDDPFHKSGPYEHS